MTQGQFEIPSEESGARPAPEGSVRPGCIAQLESARSNEAGSGPWSIPDARLEPVGEIALAERLDEASQRLRSGSIQDVLARVRRASERIPALDLFSFDQGARLIEAGEPSPTIDRSFLVLDGEIALFANQLPEPLRVLYPGEIFDQASGEQGAPVSAQAARGPAVLLAVPSALLLHLCRSERTILTSLRRGRGFAHRQQLSLAHFGARTRSAQREAREQNIESIILTQASAVISAPGGVSQILNPWRQTYIDPKDERLLGYQEQLATYLTATEMLLKEGRSEREVLELALAVRKEAYFSAAVSQDLVEALDNCERQAVRLQPELERLERTSAGADQRVAPIFTQRRDAIRDALAELRRRLAELIKRRDKEIGIGKRAYVAQTAQVLFAARAERASILPLIASRLAHDLVRSAKSTGDKAQIMAECFLERARLLFPASEARLQGSALNYSILFDLGLSPDQIRHCHERLLRIRWVESQVFTGRARAGAPEHFLGFLKGFEDDLLEMLRFATCHLQLEQLLDERLEACLIRACELKERGQLRASRFSEALDSLKLRRRSVDFRPLPGGASRNGVESSALTGRIALLESFRERLLRGASAEWQHPFLVKSLLDQIASGRLHCLVYHGTPQNALQHALDKHAASGVDIQSYIATPVSGLDGRSGSTLVSLANGHQIFILACESGSEQAHLGAGLLLHSTEGRRLPADRLELAGAPRLRADDLKAEMETCLKNELASRSVHGRADCNEQVRVLGLKLPCEIVPTQLVFLEHPQRDLPKIFSEGYEESGGSGRFLLAYAKDPASGQVNRLIVPNLASASFSAEERALFLEAFLNSKIGHKNPNVIVQAHATAAGISREDGAADRRLREGETFSPERIGGVDTGNLLTRKPECAAAVALLPDCDSLPTPLLSFGESAGARFHDLICGELVEVMEQHNRSQPELVKAYGPVTITALYTHTHEGAWINGAPPQANGGLPLPALKALRAVFQAACLAYRRAFASNTVLPKI